jgi:hypothetical protein
MRVSICNHHHTSHTSCRIDFCTRDSNLRPQPLILRFLPLQLLFQARAPCVLLPIPRDQEQIKKRRSKDCLYPPLCITHYKIISTQPAAAITRHHLLLHAASALLQRRSDLHRTAQLRARAATDGPVIVFAAAAAAESSCCPCSRLLFPSLFNLRALPRVLERLSTGTTLRSFDGRTEGRTWRYSAGSVAHASETGFSGSSYQMTLCSSAGWG